MNSAEIVEQDKKLLTLKEWLYQETGRRLKSNIPQIKNNIYCRFPETVLVSPNTRLDDDIFLGQGVEIRGPSTIFRKVVIQQNTFIDDSVVRSEAEIGRNNTLIRCYIGERTKIPYDAQLSDITIGQDTNIARGVTISNFDGLEKKHTWIGNRCFIGTDVNIIGGLEMGDEVRIFSKMLVHYKKRIPDHAWVLPKYDGGQIGVQIRENSSFKIPGHWRWIWTKSPIPNVEKMHKLLETIGQFFQDTSSLVDFFTKKRDELEGQISLHDILQSSTGNYYGDRYGEARFERFEAVCARFLD